MADCGVETVVSQFTGSRRQAPFFLSGVQHTPMATLLLETLAKDTAKRMRVESPPTSERDAGESGGRESGSNSGKRNGREEPGT